MNYDKFNIPGFEGRTSGGPTAKLDPAKRNMFAAIDGTAIDTYDKNPGLRALVLASYFPERDTLISNKYGVYFGASKNHLELHELEFSSRAAAETAAQVLALEYGQAHAVILDYRKPTTLKTAEDDPEAWDSFYEDNNLIRTRHPEEGSD